MQFVYPYFLYSLFALSIPILIHLFNFRRFKKILFSNVAFLQEIQQETKSVKNLKHILILICRLFAVLFLVLAFAQPYITENKKEILGGTNGISIYIDNSYSLSLKGKNGVLLEEAKSKAKEIALSFKPSDKFHLLTNDFEGKHQRLVNRDEFIKMINEISFSSSSKKTEQILSRQKDGLNMFPLQNKYEYYLSDFQKTQINIESVKNDTSINSSFIKLSPNNSENIFIDSIWFDSPFHQQNSKEKLNVRIKSSSEAENTFENIPIKLLINGVQKSLSSVNLESNDEKIVALEYTNSNTGFQTGKVFLQDAFINYDDELFFSYEIKPQIKILNLFEQKSSLYLKKVFETDNYFNFSENDILAIDYSKLKDYDLIILNNLKEISTGLEQELKKVLANGKSVFCFIPPNANIASYNIFFTETNSFNISTFDSTKIKTDKINIKHPLYNDIFELEKFKNQNIDFPSANGRFQISPSSRNSSEKLIEFIDHSPLLSIQTLKKGKIYTCYVPADSRYSNFIVHPFFVPTMYKAAMMSIPSSDLYFLLSNSKPIILEGKEISGDQELIITNSESKNEFIPSTKIKDGNTLLLLHGEPKQTGNYFVSLNQNKIKSLSFNNPRSESILEYFSESDLIDLIEKYNLNNFKLLKNNGKPIKDLIKEQVDGKRFWRQCLWLALLFLLLEIIILNLNFKSLKPKTQ